MMGKTKQRIVRNQVKHNNGGHAMGKRMVRHNAGNAGKHLYEASVKIRALRNAGGCNNLAEAKRYYRNSNQWAFIR